MATRRPSSGSAQLRPRSGGVGACRRHPSARITHQCGVSSVACGRVLVITSPSHQRSYGGCTINSLEVTSEVTAVTFSPKFLWISEPDLRITLGRSNDGITAVQRYRTVIRHAAPLSTRAPCSAPPMGWHAPRGWSTTAAARSTRAGCGAPHRALRLGVASVKLSDFGPGSRRHRRPLKSMVSRGAAPLQSSLAAAVPE